MSLLSTYEVKQKIAEEVANSKDTLQIVSAFCKVSAVEFVDQNIKCTLKTKKLMVRFLLSDILQGATDFALYEYCKANGWQMFVRFDLHAKTYIFDRQRCILGSANLTNKGLGLSLHGNYELSSFATVDDSDLAKIDKLFSDAILMTDDIYALMKSDLENAQTAASSTQLPTKWNKLIEQRFVPCVGALFTYDFPSTRLPDLNDAASLDFLIGSVSTYEELKQAFRWSKAFMWLYNYINACPEKCSYFGAVTAALHDALINDPRPYRKEVKDLLANLLGWIQELNMEEILIDRPNYSQRIRLVN